VAGAEPRQEDFLFAEHVLRRGFATEEQVQQCLRILERMRGEMELDETLEGVLLKRGYLAQAQASVIRQDINPEAAGRAKNQIEGYQLLVRLGSGAMGSVYKAQHMKLNIHVALKVLRVDLAKSKTQVERLKREAQLAAQLNHINIVRSLDVGESNGFNYFAMEYVDGKTVRQMLHRGPLKEKDALRITRDVARALEHAHAHGVVHRDIKPANIILTKEGVVKLADFGLARGKGPSDLTLDQASIGTPQYLAPEQARRAADANARSDLFSLGASLYHMVTGRPPFSGENLGEIFQKVLGSDFDPPESVVPDLGLDTVYLIHKLMRGNPRERYVNATELLADLARLEQGQRIAPADFRGDYAVYLRRRRMRRGMVGAAAIVVVAAASVLTAQMISAHNAETRRADRCRTANDVGRLELGKAKNLAELEAVHAQMLRKLHAVDCRPDEVPDLKARLETATADREMLTRAKLNRDHARDDKNPAYDALYRDTEGIARRVRLGELRLRAETFRDQIKTLSNEAARQQVARTYNPGLHATREEALASLAQLETDLRKRYVPYRVEGDIPSQVHALKTLIKEWDKADADHRAFMESNAKKHNYREAHDDMVELMRARDKARLHAQRAGLTHEAFLQFFPDDNPYLLDLLRAEQDYYTRVVKRKVDDSLAKNDPDAAEKTARAFREKAFDTRGRVDGLISTIGVFRTDTQASQGKEIAKLREVVRRALADRQYGRAFRLVSTAYARGGWMEANRAALKRLHAEATMYERLRKRYVAKGGQPETLGDLETDAVLKTLAFDNTAADDVRLRGYFYLVESYVADNPRTEAAMLARAIRDLNRADDNTASLLQPREELAKAAAAKGEADASGRFETMRAADKRNDLETAHHEATTLLKRLQWTDFVANWRPQIVAMRDKCDRIAGTQLIRKRAGIPPRNFFHSVESGRSRFKFDFVQWWPDEDKVVAAERDRVARSFWQDFFRKYREEKLTDASLERVKRQLIWFNEHLVAHKDGSARFHPGVDEKSQLRPANTAFWVPADRRPGLRVITLHNPFRADKDWSIEVAVSWDVTVEGKDKAGTWLADGRDKDVRTPIYFALTAGQFQAGILAADWPNGGGDGARLFKQVSVHEGIEDLFSDFYQRKLHRKRPRRPDRAYVKLRANETYRIRLERRGARIHCTIGRQDDWLSRDGKFDPTDPVLKLNVPAKTLARDMELPDLGKVFRFFSLEPCRLHEVVIEGERGDAKE
jgi:serine/threonine-protein kinase